MAGDDAVRLTDNYPFAFSDFHGRGTPCVYKSGPAWPTYGSLGEPLIREPRPVYGHAIQPTWVSIGTRICNELSSNDIIWTFINPFAYANAGEPKPFCPLVICVGVNPRSLSYDAAVTGTALVKKILGFPDVEVAFIESVMTRSSTGSNLLSFNPLVNKVPDLRKPFTPTLGLSIASRENPFCEGTGALYFRLPGDRDRVAVLTCAHVTRPTQTKCADLEEIIALGMKGYENAITAMTSTIDDHLQDIDAWNDAISRLGEGDSEEAGEKHDEYLGLVGRATKEIQTVKAIHAEVTENFATLDQRTIGFVLHAENIEASEPYEFSNDWALIELYKEKFDWKTFRGNKVWVGGRLSVADYGNLLFPQPEDRKGYKYPQDGLLQAFGIVRDDEMHNPQHLDVHGEKCLLVVKNGLATGTTVGRLNGLESFTRVGVNQKSLEIAVLPYHGPFSEAGDSGSVVLDRAGRIVGILTGGSGPTDETDTSYLTPYWWIEEQVKAKFPGCVLYEVVP